MRICMHPSPKCPYDAPDNPRRLEQFVEPPQVGTQSLRRHGGILPTTPRLSPIRPPGRQPGRIGPTPPQHSLSLAILTNEAVQANHCPEFLDQGRAA